MPGPVAIILLSKSLGSFTSSPSVTSGEGIIMSLSLADIILCPLFGMVEVGDKEVPRCWQKLASEIGRAFATSRYIYCVNRWRFDARDVLINIVWTFYTLYGF